MNLDWYLFEHSYLTGINVDVIGCLLTLSIDAKKTYRHPNVEAESNEHNYQNIEFIFEGVQYWRMINSLNLLTNPNEDIGSIEKLCLKDSNAVSSGISFNVRGNQKIISLDLSKNSKVDLITTSKSLYFLNFVSEMITFEIGCEKYSINEND